MAELKTSTACYSVGSASTSTNLYPYQVFISHRGPDVKNTLASHLYYRLRSHGLQPFLDRVDLQVGELLSLQIERAIRIASVHIVIFSPGYADSRWCLDELLLILNKSGDTIVPIFYQVKPSDLRWTGRYVQTLSNHEQKGRCDRQTIEKWRKALFHVFYYINGFELEAYKGDEGQLLDNVVQWVLEKVRYTTGPQQKVKDFESSVVSLHHRHSGKVKVLCSVDVGGLAKLTTLAKKLFNKPSYNFVHGQVEEGTLMSRDRQLVTGQVEEGTLTSKDWKTVIFKRKTLVTATKEFHHDNKIGEGGFGIVYKGTTQDGREIAVKKPRRWSQPAKQEYQNEINLMQKIQHRNIVNLLGYYSEGSEAMLVYEYLPNNSLHKILFDPSKRVQLDWEKRYNIIVGIVRGLLYLHEDSQLRIIHRDIKPSNILLDQKLNPKIADFGLAKILGHKTHIISRVSGTYEDQIHITRKDETYVSTRVTGSLGYVAPEYAMRGHLSVKADVYSFGVLLLQLVTGRKCLDLKLRHIVDWAWRSYQQNIEQMIDPSIIETCDVEQASRCIHVALLCTQADAHRPSMFKVMMMLSSRSEMLPEPKESAFDV